MAISTESLKKYARQHPRLHKTLKHTVGRIFDARNQREIKQYNMWLKRRSPSLSELQKQSKDSLQFSYRPMISLTAPTYNTNEAHLRQMIESVIHQTYSNWELVIVDDASPDEQVREVIKEYQQNDSRIRSKFLETNHHIAGATNQAIDMVSGEFTALFDHDDLLMPNALYEVVASLNDNHELDFIYTDEDKVTEQGKVHYSPHFKPDWNPDLLLSINYITHLAVIRTSILKSIGGLRKKYNGAQDWDLFLRLAQTVQPERIHHIPRLLYSWRTHPNSTAQALEAKPYVIDAQRNALVDNAGAITGLRTIVNRDKTYPGQWQVEVAQDTVPSVTVLLLNGTPHSGVASKTDYPNVQYIELPTGATYQQVLESTDDDYIAILQNGKCPVDKNWLQMMVSDAKRNNIGFVGSAYAVEHDWQATVELMLGKPIRDFIADNKEGALTSHNLRTTRYDVPKIFSSCAVMIQRSKLKTHIIDEKQPYNIEAASEQLSQAGFRNLYNPYVRMLK